ncbi:MAG: N(4)-(beta-N-acetylglucosaminyl)-L-asparaginase [Terriglobales bacterium]|jgi:N4-(beta-N-acetylglucosaminyl)-L-asparaginase
MDRRNFLATATLASLGLTLEAQEVNKQDSRAAAGKHEASAVGGPPSKPVMVSSRNGWNGIDKGYQMLLDGGDTLDAVIAVGKTQEDDPNDDSVGLGGLPNEEGVVELDSCCMHGPTRRAGAVGGVRWTKNPSLLAQAVMQHTGHVMLVGEGADRFAKAMGFPKDELLTERSRKAWLLWKESHRDSWWGPGLSDPNCKVPPDVQAPAAPGAAWWEKQRKELEELAADLAIPPSWRAHCIDRVLFPIHGTIHCSAVTPKGEMSGMTTTCGLSWKIPGRCGDSPIIGAGSYTDQDVGSAGATGSGEENIRVAGAHTVIENMRHGMSPREAGLDALQRIARNYQHNPAKLRYVDMQYYIVRKDGAYAAVSLWSHGASNLRRQFIVHDGTRRLEEMAFLLQGTPLPFPPQAREPFQRPNYGPGQPEKKK